MTHEEVTQIVGRPHRIEQLEDNRELWWYGPPYSNQLIGFADGEVVGFEKNIQAEQEGDAT